MFIYIHIYVTIVKNAKLILPLFFLQPRLEVNSVQNFLCLKHLVHAPCQTVKLSKIVQDITAVLIAKGLTTRLKLS